MCDKAILRRDTLFVIYILWWPYRAHLDITIKIFGKCVLNIYVEVTWFHTMHINSRLSKIKTGGTVGGYF